MTQAGSRHCVAAGRPCGPIHNYIRIRAGAGLRLGGDTGEEALDAVVGLTEGGAGAGVHPHKTPIFNQEGLLDEEAQAPCLLGESGVIAAG